MDKTKLSEIIKNEPERIKKVKLEKYKNEPFAESGYRVQIDGTDTKFCWCSICTTFFSADSNHTLGNIRSHHMGHKSRKRTTQNTMENYFVKKTKLSLSQVEIDEYRKVATQSLCMAGQPNSYFESAGATVLFDGIQRKFCCFIQYELYITFTVYFINYFRPSQIG